MAARIKPGADAVAFVEGYLDSGKSDVYLVDSSSLIDMVEHGVDVKGPLSTTFQIMEEIQNHAARGKLPAYAAAQVALVSAAKPQDHMKIKEDVLRAYHRACSDKKQTRDSISQADAGFIVEAIKHARSGKTVSVLSEDQHIYATLGEMLSNGYSNLASRIELVRIRKLLR
jgi:hypothetical protein